MEHFSPENLRPESREVFAEAVRTQQYAIRSALREARMLWGDEKESFVRDYVARNGVDLQTLLRDLLDLDAWYEKEDEYNMKLRSGGRISAWRFTDLNDALNRKYRKKLRTLRMRAHGVDRDDLGRISEEYDDLIEGARRAAHGMESKEDDNETDETDENEENEEDETEKEDDDSHEEDRGWFEW